MCKQGLSASFDRRHNGSGGAMEPCMLQRAQFWVGPLKGLEGRLSADLIEGIPNVGTNVDRVARTAPEVVLDFLGHAESCLAGTSRHVAPSQLPSATAP